jgi:integrase
VALKLIPPGKRGPYYVIRGRVGGILVERSAKTSNLAAARQRLRELEAQLGDLPSLSQVTFAQAAQKYIEFRNPSRVDRQRLEKVVHAIGSRRLREITAADLHEMVSRLGGRLEPATRNRNYLRPAVTVLHYAAGAGLCPYIRVQSFREPRARTRALGREAALSLIAAATPGPQRLLVTWLFCQGTRISDTLRVKWDDIDLEAGTVRVHVSKTDNVWVFPLHEAVSALLAGDRSRGVYVFPWRHRWEVKWLRQLGDEIGVHFTAHMARHSLGTWLNEDGAGLRTIMEALGHADVHSSIRYQGASVEIVRAAINKVRMA